ncbi:hypothetical protein D1BOALGB6SA_3770 [Olavius sp. associated proteobacterium Delta 1]|nr:hypothetical protein D1BOALGB6SA_3770 [Olavius sp. associated proteobacterium Delta 1]
MIAIEIGCCLRPLGIVLNEQLWPNGFRLTINPSIEHNILLSCSLLFIHYESLWPISCGFGGD